MEQSIKIRVEGLLAQAELAVDETANGLMDRGDFLHFIAEFVEVTNLLVQRCDDLEQERDDSTSRLQRKPHLGALKPLNSLALSRPDVARAY